MLFTLSLARFSHKIRLRWCVWKTEDETISSSLYLVLDVKERGRSFAREKKNREKTASTTRSIIRNNMLLSRSLSLSIAQRVHYSWCLVHFGHIFRLMMAAFVCVQHISHSIFVQLEIKEATLTAGFILFPSFHFDRCDRLDSFVLRHFKKKNVKNTQHWWLV